MKFDSSWYKRFIRCSRTQILAFFRWKSFFFRLINHFSREMMTTIKCWNNERSNFNILKRIKCRIRNRFRIIRTPRKERSRKWSIKCPEALKTIILSSLTTFWINMPGIGEIRIKFPIFVYVSLADAHRAHSFRLLKTIPHIAVDHKWSNFSAGIFSSAND